MHDFFGKTVIVLVDEYDAGILNSVMDYVSNYAKDSE
jgi:hypothetical protein